VICMSNSNSHTLLKLKLIGYVELIIITLLTLLFADLLFLIGFRNHLYDSKSSLSMSTKYLNDRTKSIFYGKELDSNCYCF